MTVLVALVTASFAGPCDAHAAKASTATGSALVDAYSALVKCDPALAEGKFMDFMKASGDVGTLVQVSLVAIDADLYTPVWAMMEKIPDYEARDEAAKGIGAACTSHPKVMPFVQGAYFGLRELQFAQWDDALVTCEAPEVDAWLAGLVEKPPTSSYSEKYKVVVTGWAKRKRATGLASLEKGAIEAGKAGGPFATALDAMELAIQSDEIGGEPSAADVKSWSEALIRVATAVEPSAASQIAERLSAGGQGAAAAGLLSKIYADKLQGGRLSYGVAAVEACEQDVVVHYAVVSDPAKRWSVLTDAEPQARAWAPKLKCGAKDWPVTVTATPVAGIDDVAAWVADVGKPYADKGAAVKTREEKEIALQ